MVSRDKNEHELSHLSVQWLIRIFSPLKPAFCRGSAGVAARMQRLSCITLNSERRRHTLQAADLLCQKVLMRNMKCYVMNRGLTLPHKRQKKDKENICLSVLFSIFCPLLSLYTHPTPLLLSHCHPPPLTLTLACLSGLLPCIPPFPVWPLSQEVAQLVDKHHGDGEEGLGNSRPLRLCQYSAGKKMERSRGFVTGAEEVRGWVASGRPINKWII